MTSPYELMAQFMERVFMIHYNWAGGRVLVSESKDDKIDRSGASNWSDGRRYED